VAFLVVSTGNDFKLKPWKVTLSKKKGYFSYRETMSERKAIKPNKRVVFLF